MYGYREQYEMLEPVKLREGESKRLDCPFCGGTKTLSLSRHNGRRKWNCFKASCSTAGIAGAPMSADTLRSRLDNADKSPGKSAGIAIPEKLSNVTYHERAVDYLRTVNCEPHLNWVDTAYAPAEDRLLFFFGQGTGAVGRSLRGDKPKWKLYGSPEDLVRFGAGETAVVVEDVPSAIRCGALTGIVGCALLGTNLSRVQRRELARFRTVIIALDKDASRKAVDLTRRLEDRCKVRVALLDEDIKHMPNRKVRDVLGLDRRIET